MSATERKKKEVSFRQEHIIEAAEKVFFARGVKNTTMEDIAKASDYTKRSLYSYFKTKEEIYFEIIRRAYLLLRDEVLVDMEHVKKETGWVKLVTMSKAFVGFVKKYPEHYKVIAHYQSLKNDNDPDGEEEYLAEGEDLFEFLVFIIREGKQDGSLRGDLDEVTTAYVLWATVVGMGTLIRKNEINFYRRYPRSNTVLVEEMLRYALRSIGTQPVPDKLS
jgi:AcrR family transcriptional regulator